MDKKIVLVSLIVLLLIIYYKRNIGVIEKMSVVEAFNRKKFLVRDLIDKKESADLLAKLIENLKLLISTLRNTNNPNDKELQKLFSKNENLEFYEYELEYEVLKKGLKNVDEIIYKSCINHI